MNKSSLEPNDLEVDAGEASGGRLLWIDAFRGLALMLVLVDHLDMFTGGRAVIRTWTLMGIGYSDAAEVFAFLSGVSFGWIYERRFNQHGFLACQWRVIKRVVLIYLAFQLLGQITLCMAPFAPIFRKPSDTARLEMFYFAYQPVGLGILAMYVVIIPFLPLWFALYRRLPWLAVLIGVGLHTVPQWYSAWFHSSGASTYWYFLPLGWQLLIVIGVIVGASLRRGKLRLPRSPWLAAAGGVLLLAALAVKKSDWLGIENYTVGTSFYQTHASTIRWLEDKSSLGWLRVVHFFALVYVVWYACSNRAVDWENRWLQPLIVCGRQPLLSYCVGHLLICAVVLVLGYPISDPWILWLLAFDLCMLQAMVVGAVSGGYRKSWLASGISSLKSADSATN